MGGVEPPVTKRIASKIADSIITLNGYSREKYAVLQFGMELIVSSVIGCLLLAAISLFTGKPSAWIFFLVGFAPLKTSAGGYHAPTHFWCYVVTTGAFAVAALLHFLTESTTWVPLSLSILAWIVTILLSPVETHNKALSMQKKKRNRMVSINIVNTNVLFLLCMVLLKIHHFAISYIGLGVFAAAGSLLAAKIQNLIRKE